MVEPQAQRYKYLLAGGAADLKRFDAGSTAGHEIGAFRLAGRDIFRHSKPETHHHE